MDANHLLYLVRACQLFIAGHGGDLKKSLAQLQAKTLFLPAEKDMLLMPYLAEDAHNTLQQLDKQTHIEIMPGSLGHLEGVAGIAQKAQQIKQFLSK